MLASTPTWVLLGVHLLLYKTAYAYVVARDGCVSKGINARSWPSIAARWVQGSHQCRHYVKVVLAVSVRQRLARDGGGDRQ